jgi:hypothetical protein
LEIAAAWGSVTRWKEKGGREKEHRRERRREKKKKKKTRKKKRTSSALPRKRKACSREPELARDLASTEYLSESRVRQHADVRNPRRAASKRRKRCGDRD